MWCINNTNGFSVARWRYTNYWVLSSSDYYLQFLFIQHIFQHSVQAKGIKSFARLTCTGRYIYVHVYHIQQTGRHSRCSCSRPCSLILLASCCAFLFSRQILDAYLFFSRGDTEQSPAVPGVALTTAVNRWSSSPIWSKRRGFASKSDTDRSPRCPEYFADVRGLALVTGSWKDDMWITGCRKELGCRRLTLWTFWLDIIQPKVPFLCFNAAAAAAGRASAPWWRQSIYSDVTMLAYQTAK